MFQFEIYGIPVAQKQTQYARIPGGGIRAYDPSSKDKAILQWQVRPTAPSTPLTCPVELTITFFMPIPKSSSKALRRQMINRIVLPAKKPDIDNMGYLVSNALKGIVYQDDNQVCVQHMYKFYSEEPKTVIQVRPILTLEPVGYNSTDSQQEII